MAAPAPDGERENWDLVGDFANKSLRLKADRWQKAVQHGDTRDNILKFFDGDTEQVSNILNRFLFNTIRIEKLEVEDIFILF